jgi:hypothetical protein
MCVVFFRHSGVGVPQLRSNDAQSDPLHRQGAGMGMPQHVKIHRR